MTKRKNKSSKKKGSSEDVATIVRVKPGNGWAPSRIATRLRFSKFVTISAAAATAANVRITPTFAYDVDPTVGSTSMAGFSEYAGMYRFYRVQKSMITVHFANEQAFNVVVYVIPINSDPGANYSSTVAQQYLANPFCRQSILGPLTGRNTSIVRHRETTANYGGAWNRNVTDTYVGSTAGTTPSNNWFWSIGLVGTSNVSTGVDALITCDVDIEFFELANPSS
jgi:hypothetical protein